ncbi:MAG TPA: cysteine desulfurase family protein [Candidatus Nanopelagicaceae bacterium]
MPVYLDHAATTPMADVALEVMTEQLKHLGNPSSLHSFGREVRKDLESAREEIAIALDCHPSEIIFTASGTEANNTALKGLYWKGQAVGRNVVVVSAIEHHAILDPAEWLKVHEGAEVIEIGVDSNGVVHLDELEDLIARRADEIAVISIMSSNNETGVLQPVDKVVELARSATILVHSDAVQSFGKVPLSFSNLGLTAMSVSAHKLGGPIGVGALVLRKGFDVPALLHGGGQERDIRSGTFNAPSILAFAAAVKENSHHFAERNAKVLELRQKLTDGILERVPDAYVNGMDAERLPGIVNVTIPGTESDTLLLLLDNEGIACSTGSACTAGVQRPSHVLLAMGHTDRTARSSIRFSLGATSTQFDVDQALLFLPSVIERARMANLR